jgi:hypothetical protein
MRPFWSVGRMAVLAGVAVLAACAGASGPTLPADAPIRIENSQMFVTVENRSGLALRDVQVRIIPVGGTTEFIASVYRLENGEKRDFPLSAFRGRDGTPFNLRVVRPKSVKVSGTDINNKTIEVETAWKR